jgi:hypothetical protein
MRLDRRSFLELASTGPLVFGLGDLLAINRFQAIPTWWESALKRMKDADQPGLVFIAPSEVEAQVTLGQALLALLDGGDIRAREIFCTVVGVALSPEAAKICLPASSEPGQVLVLEFSGKVVATSDFALDTMRDPGLFAETVDKLVGARLVKKAEAVRGKVTEEEKRAFETLDAEEVEIRGRAAEILARNAGRLMPLLVIERRSATLERAGRLRQVIDGYIERWDENTPGPRLPFGTRSFAILHTGCLPQDEGEAVQCGMGRMEVRGREFLRFLTR